MPTLSWEERCGLAELYAPHMVLFPEEQARGRPNGTTGVVGDYYPRGVEPLLERSQIFSGFFRPRRPASIQALALCTRKNELLIVGKLFPDPILAWQTYFDILNKPGPDGKTGRERYPYKIYARVQTRGEANAASKVRSNLGPDFPLSADEVGRPFFASASDADENDLSIQYWFCYYYDDWANKHEGDWEGINVFLKYTESGYEPVGAGYAEHETGKRRHWAEVERSTMGGTHPIVYIGAGSHASYFQYVKGGYFTTVPGFILPLISIRVRVYLSTTRLDRVADSNQFKPIEPRVDVFPDPIGPGDTNDPAWVSKKWLGFAGPWGVRVFGEFGYGGPTGPSQKGLKWHNPFAWIERYCSPDFFVY